MAENFGVQGRGAFYDATGAIRDVIENHMFQVLSNLAMDPPARTDSEPIRNEKVKVLEAVPAIEVTDVVRGQFAGYLNEQGVAPNSTTETFAAVRLWINSWRWKGVPFYIRAGKNLAVTGCGNCGAAAKASAHLPNRSGNAEYVRIEVSPDVALAIGVTVISPKSDNAAMPTELTVSRHPNALDEESAYERLLFDAMEGDSTLFAREDYVEEAWRIVDPMLKAPTPVYQYRPGTWGPAEVDERVCPPGGWVNPSTS